MLMYSNIFNSLILCTVSHRKAATLFFSIGFGLVRRTVKRNWLDPQRLMSE